MSAYMKRKKYASHWLYCTLLAVCWLCVVFAGSLVLAGWFGFLDRHFFQ